MKTNFSKNTTRAEDHKREATRDHSSKTTTAEDRKYKTMRVSFWCIMVLPGSYPCILQVSFFVYVVLWSSFDLMVLHLWFHPHAFWKERQRDTDRQKQRQTLTDRDRKTEKHCIKFLFNFMIQTTKSLNKKRNCLYEG